MPLPLLGYAPGVGLQHCSFGTESLNTSEFRLTEDSVRRQITVELLFTAR